MEEIRKDIRVVDYNGDELSVIRMNDDNKVYVSVRSVCRGLGLDENRAKGQREKVNSDPVLIRGKRVIAIPTNGGIQNVLCLDVEFLPLWIAKINAYILPENVQNKIIDYQLHVKEVLSKVFIKNEPALPQGPLSNLNMTGLPAETQALVMVVNSIAQTQLEQQRQATVIKTIERQVAEIKDVYTISATDNSWRERTNNIINTICRAMNDYKAPKDEIYDKLNKRAHCNINLRVENMKKRAEKAGWSRSRVDQINKLDAIAADDTLKEIYIQIVKEFAIFNGYQKEDLADIQ